MQLKYKYKKHTTCLLLMWLVHSEVFQELKNYCKTVIIWISKKKNSFQYYRVNIVVFSLKMIFILIKIIFAGILMGKIEIVWKSNTFRLKHWLQYLNMLYKWPTRKPMCVALCVGARYIRTYKTSVTSRYFFSRHSFHQ